MIEEINNILKEAVKAFISLPVKRGVICNDSVSEED